MSNPIDFAVTEKQVPVSTSKDQSTDVVAHAVPTTTVPPQTSPSASSKKSKSKSKKSKSKSGPKIALTMSDLYLSDNLFKSTNVKSDVTASGMVKSTADVDASAKASETLGLV
ncbi:hypothetical protein A2U01_0054999, partial [Trifolium medium]|nr:hypothetical protein [Trifolium medium]